MTPSHRATPVSIPEQRRALRRELLEQRRALAPEAQYRVTADLFHRVLRWPRLHHSQRIGLYIPGGGEADPLPLLHWCLGQGRHTHLPTLSPLHEGKMYFVPVTAGEALHSNRWGIPEPALHRVTSPRALDLVFVPLVGFDRRGNRLGMGKGFYDRCFAFRNRQPGSGWPAPGRPILAGLAHSFQERGSIPSQPWDVSLDVIFTPDEMIVC